MSVSCRYCVFSNRGLCDWLIPPSDKSYPVCESVCVCVCECDQVQQYLYTYTDYVEKRSRLSKKERKQGLKKVHNHVFCNL
jgi:hypothetical protein